MPIVAHANGGVTATGEGVPTFVAITLKSALKMYAATGIKPNRAWTPTAMLRKAEAITGKRFKRGQYAEAIAALETWLAARGNP